MTDSFRVPRVSHQRPLRLGVLISGGGTTLCNLHERIQRGTLTAEVKQVIASRPECGGIERAESMGYPVSTVARSDFPGTAEFSAATFEQLDQAQVDLVVLAGYLSLLEIPQRYRYRVMNIHPSLIPAFCGPGFYGARVHRAAIERGVRVSGCTVHFADNEYDHGPIIVQQVVQVPDGATAEQLAELVFQAECEAYPQAVQLYADGRLEIQGQHVRIREEPNPDLDGPDGARR